MANKYSVILENDKVVEVEVNGKRYKNLDQIPGDLDRARMLLIVDSLSKDVDLERPEKDTEGMTKVLFGIFLAVTLLMFSIAGIASYISLRSISREVSTQGNVIDLIERKDSDGNVFYYPVVEFYLPDGTVMTAQVPEGSWPAAYIRGQAVTVAYNPDKPVDARIKSKGGMSGMWIVPMISGILGLSFLAATIFTGWLWLEDVKKGKPVVLGGEGENQPTPSAPA